MILEKNNTPTRMSIALEEYLISWITALWEAAYKLLLSIVTTWCPKFMLSCDLLDTDKLKEEEDSL